MVATLSLELRALPRPALLLVAKDYAQNRRQAAALPDFFIGTHAMVEG